jgi:hypothetical protein
MKPNWKMFPRKILFDGENAMLEDLSFRGPGETDAFKR